MQKKDQIDASLLLELCMETKRSQSRNLHEKIAIYFYQVEHRRKNGFISLGTLGEIFNALRKIKDKPIRQQAVDRIFDLISGEGITINSSLRNTFAQATALLNEDFHLEPQDALRIAEAFTHGAQLITIDQKLINNRRIQEKFNVIIKAPY